MICGWNAEAVKKIVGKPEVKEAPVERENKTIITLHERTFMLRTLHSIHIASSIHVPHRDLNGRET